MTFTNSSDDSLTGSALRETVAIWKFFHDLFRFPSRKQWEWLQTEKVDRAWRLLCERLAPELPGDFPRPGSYSNYEEDFLATFEVGAPQPICPLIESHWNKQDPLPRILHENLLFYKQFGLELQDQSKETADHIRHQLEFMSYLCSLETRLMGSGSEQTLQIQEARKDYWTRHLVRWIPQAAEELRKKNQEICFAHWMHLLERFVDSQINGFSAWVPSLDNGR